MCTHNCTFIRNNWHWQGSFYTLATGVGPHGAGKQSMRCVLFSTECPGAKEWACCHPGGFECFITAYTKDQLPTARSLTSGQQWRQKPERGLPLSCHHTCFHIHRARLAQHEGWLAVRWTPGKASQLSCLCLFDNSRVSDNGLLWRTTKNSWTPQLCHR